MRKANAIISAAILVLFLIHGTMGAMTLLGAGHINFKPLAWFMLGLILIHGIIGTILTVQTLISCKKTGAPYFKDNALFWARRISGFAIMLFIFFHITAFSYTAYGVYRLKIFGGFKLFTQIMLILSIAVHVLTNIRPMFVALGAKEFKNQVANVLLFLAILMFVMALSFIVYFIRWKFL